MYQRPKAICGDQHGRYDRYGRKEQRSVKNKIILEEILRTMQKKQRGLAAELSAAPDGQLLLVQKDGRAVMQQCKEEHGQKRRLSLAGKPDLAAALIRKQYAEAELQLLKKDVTVITELLQRYNPVDYQSVLELLPEKYRQFERSQYMEGRAKTQDSWMHMPYKQSDYHPKQKVHATSQGLFVRSKSEVLLAEKLYEMKIPFRYEQTMKIGKFTVAPDFTCNVQKQLVYIEHCGLTGNAEYMKHHKWKMELYESVGIVPWKNLIVTYEDENGFINLAVMEAQMKAMLL